MCLFVCIIPYGRSNKRKVATAHCGVYIVHIYDKLTQGEQCDRDYVNGGRTVLGNF